MVVQLTFSLDHAFHAAKTLEVGLSKIGDIAKIRLGNIAQKSDLFFVVGPHFHNGNFRIVRNGQKGEGHANMVVQVALGGNGPIRFGEHRIDELLGRGLAIAPGKPNDAGLALLSVVQGQFLEGFQHVLAEDVLAGGVVFLFIDHGIGCSFFQGILGKGIAVEVGSLEREEQAVFGDLSRVRTDNGMLQKELVKLFHCHKSKIKKSPN